MKKIFRLKNRATTDGMKGREREIFFFSFDLVIGYQVMMLTNQTSRTAFPQTFFLNLPRRNYLEEIFSVEKVLQNPPFFIYFRYMHPIICSLCIMWLKLGWLSVCMYNTIIRHAVPNVAEQPGCFGAKKSRNSFNN